MRRRLLMFALALAVSGCQVFRHAYEPEPARSARPGAGSVAEGTPITRSHVPEPGPIHAHHALPGWGSWYGPGITIRPGTRTVIDPRRPLSTLPPSGPSPAMRPYSEAHPFLD